MRLDWLVMPSDVALNPTHVTALILRFPDLVTRSNPMPQATTKSHNETTTTLRQLARYLYTRNKSTTS